MVWPASKKQRICAPCAPPLHKLLVHLVHCAAARGIRCGCAVAARVKNALIAVCQEQGDLHSTLHMRYGIEIEEVSPMADLSRHVHASSTPRKSYLSLSETRSLLWMQVRMAPDNLTAYVLWDAFPGPAREAAAELERL